MNIEINNNHEIGDLVSFFESSFTHSNNGLSAWSETVQKEGRIKKMDAKLEPIILYLKKINNGTTNKTLPKSIFRKHKVQR